LRRLPAVLILRRALWLLVLERVVARPRRDGLGESAELVALKSPAPLASRCMAAGCRWESIGVGALPSTMGRGGEIKELEAEG